MVKGNLEVSRYFEKKKLQPYLNQSNLQLFPFNYRKRRNSRIAINCKVFIKIVVNEKWKLHNGLTERMRYVSAKVCNKILFCFSHKYPTSSFFSKLGFFIRNVFGSFLATAGHRTGIQMHYISFVSSSSSTDFVDCHLNTNGNDFDWIWSSFQLTSALLYPTWIASILYFLTFRAGGI